MDDLNEQLIDSAEIGDLESGFGHFEIQKQVELLKTKIETQASKVKMIYQKSLTPKVDGKFNSDIQAEINKLITLKSQLSTLIARK